jgi:hypothetical protein
LLRTWSIRDVVHTSEYFLGYYYDDRFGPLLAFGTGRANLEIGSRFATMPLTPSERLAIVSRASGLRGLPASAMAETMKSLEGIALRTPDFRAIDPNSRVVRRNKIVALDAKLHPNFLEGMKGNGAPEGGHRDHSALARRSVSPADLVVNTGPRQRPTSKETYGHATK